MSSRVIEIDARRVRVMDPDERMWSDSTLTRADIVAYYLDVASDLLPCLTRRPASTVIKRSADPEGWCFQRGALPGLPAWIPRCRGWDELRMSNVECPLVEERAAYLRVDRASDQRLQTPVPFELLEIDERIAAERPWRDLHGKRA